jgi:hypothetical protein
MDELASSRSEELKGFDCIFIHIGTQRRKAGLEGQIKLERDDTLAVARYSSVQYSHKAISRLILHQNVTVFRSKLWMITLQYP